MDNKRGCLAFFSVGCALWITALATFALAYLTLSLARATKHMAIATHSANVVASLESNQWHMTFFDLVIHNAGNAPAYDVFIQFDPPLPYSFDDQETSPPLAGISLIRPGQLLSSSVGDIE